MLGAMAAGFRIALRSTGRTDNVMVLQKGADGEMTSGIPRSGTSLMSVDNRVARDAKGQPMASPEILIVANLKRITDNQETNVALRGVTLKALEVRDQIKITQGRAFQPGLYEMIVGERTARALWPGSRQVDQAAAQGLADRRRLLVRRAAPSRVKSGVTST